MQQTARPPGRPKDPQVQARDEAIYELIVAGLRSRRELATRTGFDREAVHLSCKRLQAQGRIRTCLGDNGAAVWTIADNSPCP